MEKYKEKVPDVSDPNQNIEITCNSKLKFYITWRSTYQKGAEKLVKDELKVPYVVYIYLGNTPILNIQSFSRRYHFRLWIFASTGEYFYYWHWRVLPNVLTK